MRRIATLAVTVFLALTALGAVRPASAQAASPLELKGAVTDNYKAIWNADPEIRENRTWLAFDAVEVNGVLYSAANLPDVRDYTAEAALTGNDGSTAVLKVAAGANVVNKPIRTEAIGTFGPLLVLKDTSTLVNAPVRVTLTVERNGAVIGSTVVEYRYEDAIYNAPADNREYNSPGGRFWIGCTPTRLDWQGTYPADDCGEQDTDEVIVDGHTCTIVGTAGADTLTGTSGRDVICGLGGNDRLAGLGGNDVLLGSDGNDTLEGGAGDDVVTGGAGRDTMSFRSATRGVVINMRQLPHPAWDGPAGDANIGWDEVAGVEAAIGSKYADTLLGSGANNRFNGGAGNDTIYGYGGRDLVIGGAGNDRLHGGSGNDTLRGSTGTDHLDGATNTDRCATGGQARDTKTNCER